MPPALEATTLFRVLVELKAERIARERPAAAKDFRSLVKNRLTTLLDLPLCALTPAVFVALDRHLALDRGYAEASIAAAFDTAKALLHEAVVAGAIERNPLPIPRALRTLARKINDDLIAAQQVLEEDELVALLEHGVRKGGLSPDEHVVIAACACAGLRSGESIGLFHDSVRESPVAGELADLVIEWTYKRKAKLLERCTKSGVRRHVPIEPTRFAPIVARAADRFRRRFGAAPSRFSILAPRSRDGRPVHQLDTQLLEHFERACDRLGIRRRTLRALRHTFISRLHRAGVADDLVRRMTHPSRKPTAGEREDAVYRHHDWIERCAAIRKYFNRGSR